MKFTGKLTIAAAMALSLSYASQAEAQSNNRSNWNRSRGNISRGNPRAWNGPVGRGTRGAPVNPFYVPPPVPYRPMIISTPQGVRRMPYNSRVWNQPRPVYPRTSWRSQGRPWRGVDTRRGGDSNDLVRAARQIQRQRQQRESRRNTQQLIDAIEQLNGSSGKRVWRCTAYGTSHDNPSDCSKPEDGGSWEYVEDD